MANIIGATFSSRVNITTNSGSNCPFLSIAQDSQPLDTAYGTGTNNNQINLGALTCVTATTSGTQISLTSGLSDLLGAAIAFSHVNNLSIYNNGAVDVTVSGSFFSFVLTGSYTNTTAYVMVPGGSLSINNPASGFGTGPCCILFTASGTSGTCAIEVSVLGRNI